MYISRILIYTITYNLTSVLLGLEPCASRNSAVAICPCLHATCKAVYPSL